jgi:xanthine dehydrogenase accessory factor
MIRYFIEVIKVADIYREISQELTQGREIVLATIVQQKGSAPRSQGTNCLILPDGTLFGTIGGGLLEARVLGEARKVFSEGKNKTLLFRLNGKEAAETEMICGGQVEIYLELLSGRNPIHRRLFQKVLELQREGRPSVLATLMEDPWDQNGKKFLFWPDKKPLGKIPLWVKPVIKELRRLLEEKRINGITFRVPQTKKKIFLEPLIAPSHLCIFGAGHISTALSRLGKMVGFRVTVFDDRAEFANPQRFPDADEIVVKPFEEIFYDYLFGENDFIAVITRGHLYDHQIIRQILKTTPAYVGMIGSRQKRGIIFRALRKEGFPEALIRSIHTPIGLDIQAETPEEIAVSITAELISVRRKGKIKPKR